MGGHDGVSMAVHLVTDNPPSTSKDIATTNSVLCAEVCEGCTLLMLDPPDSSKMKNNTHLRTLVRVNEASNMPGQRHAPICS